MGDVFQFLIDSTSGLVPGSVDGKALIAGVCSKGQVGKGYLIGKRTDLAETLGTGPLVDRLRDILSTGGQDPYVVAVPVAGQEDGTISTPVQDGDGPAIDITGTVLAGAEIMIQITKSGGLNEGTFKVSVDGGDNYERARTIPFDGVHDLVDYGVSINFPEGDYEIGTTYECRLLPPSASIVDVMAAIEKPLGLYDVEFVHVVGESDSVDWAAGAALMDELWNAHRPTYIKFETRLPHDGEDLNDFTEWLLSEKQDFAAKFVQVCCQFGEVSDSTGLRKIRNWAGLQSGRVLSVPVQRATGRVRDGNIVQGTLPDGWDAVQPTLEEAGYLTAKKYAGLAGAYWGDSRTMADAVSDFRYEEVLRVVFKATRLLRIQALKSLYDEAGDALLNESAGGIAYLKANLENALNVMKTAIPSELADYVVAIPFGQDIANNGLGVEYTLIGIPIIRTIKLFGKYVYAGSTFDPRLQAA